MNPRRLALLVAGGVVFLDQLTKWWAVTALADGPIELIPDLLQLALIRNPGAAFGLLRGAGSIIALVAIVAVAGVFLALPNLRRRLDAVALGLVLGGAIGNLIDRVARGDGLFDGEVIDFFDLSFFPAFNVADAAITIGAALALLEALRSRPTDSSSPSS